MTEIRRRNHFLPEFYLAGFTPSGSKDDKLWVLDKQENRQWNTGIVNVAVQKDFYAVEIPEVEPDAIEKAFAEIEGQIAPVIQKLRTHGTLPKGSDLEILANFVALVAVRVPRIRNTISNFIEDVYKRLFGLMVITPEQWDHEVEKIKRDGVVFPSEPKYEDMKELVDSDDYSIDMGQNQHVGNLLAMAKDLVPVMAKRQWSLIFAIQNTGDFICSDSPVALSWAEGANAGPLPPGFAMPNTELTIPLSRYITLRGRFEGEAKAFAADEISVASINSRTGSSAERFMYSTDKTFTWLTRNGVIGDTPDLMAEIARKKNESNSTS